MQDDQPDGHVGACRAFGTQLQPTILYRYTINYWLRLLDSTNVQNPAEHSSGRRMCLFLSTPRPYLRVAECPNSNDVKVADPLSVEKYIVSTPTVSRILVICAPNRAAALCDDPREQGDSQVTAAHVYAARSGL